MESAECGTVGERATYGNQKGRDLLEDMHNTKEMMKRMEDWMAEKDKQSAIDRAQSAVDRAQSAVNRAEIKELKDRMANKDTQIAYHQAQLAESQAQITGLQNRVHSLTADAEGYYDIRHRFIDVYRRDIRKDATDEVSARIKKGNVKAYEGDVIVDAQLYTTGRRFDEFALIDLYGLDSNQISLLSKYLTS
jgi:chromosome segregation ATPase